MPHLLLLAALAAVPALAQPAAEAAPAVRSRGLTFVENGGAS